MRRAKVVITQYCNDPRWFVRDHDAPPYSYCDWNSAEMAVAILRREGYRVVVVPHQHKEIA